MRRGDRLFQLIQILRRTRRPVTAASIAQELEVSKRTVYRDIADLMGQRVPMVRLVLAIFSGRGSTCRP